MRDSWSLAIFVCSSVRYSVVLQFLSPFPFHFDATPNSSIFLFDCVNHFSSVFSRARCSLSRRVRCTLIVSINQSCVRFEANQANGFWYIAHWQWQPWPNTLARQSEWQRALPTGNMSNWMKRSQLQRQQRFQRVLCVQRSPSLHCEYYKWNFVLYISFFFHFRNSNSRRRAREQRLRGFHAHTHTLAELLVPGRRQWGWELEK